MVFICFWFAYVFLANGKCDPIVISNIPMEYSHTYLSKFGLFVSVFIFGDVGTSHPLTLCYVLRSPQPNDETMPYVCFCYMNIVRE